MTRTSMQISKCLCIAISTNSFDSARARAPSEPIARVVGSVAPARRSSMQRMQRYVSSKLPCTYIDARIGRNLMCYPSLTRIENAHIAYGLLNGCLTRLQNTGNLAALAFAYLLQPIALFVLIKFEKRHAYTQIWRHMQI
jgi:hypothetical protein